MISVIVPFYNTDQYLEQCLASIKGQTFSDYECLMIDDGSDDNSRAIAQKYADEDQRFVLINEPHHHIGFPLAKNLGLDKTRGEYICFVDSDDFVHEQYLEQLYKGLIESDSDICCCGWLTFKEKIIVKETKQEIKKFKEDKMISMFNGCSTFMWNKIYKRKIFENMRFDDVEALSDTMLCYKLFEKADSVSLITQTLIFHRTHDKNMTYRVRNFSPTYWEHRLNVYLDMCSYLVDRYPRFSHVYKNKFISEFCGFIRPHLKEEVYNKYNEDARVKRLLERENAYEKENINSRIRDSR